MVITGTSLSSLRENNLTSFPESLTRLGEIGKKGIHPTIIHSSFPKHFLRPTICQALIQKRGLCEEAKSMHLPLKNIQFQTDATT